MNRASCHGVCSASMTRPGDGAEQGQWDPAGISLGEIRIRRPADRYCNPRGLLTADVTLGGTTPLLAWAALAMVFGVGDVRSPVRGALGDGQVGHEVIGSGAVPVLFAVGREDDIAWAEFDDLLSAGLD